MGLFDIFKRKSHSDKQPLDMMKFHQISFGQLDYTNNPKDKREGYKGYPIQGGEILRMDPRSLIEDKKTLGALQEWRRRQHGTNR